jgi:hypothetical protein
MLAVQLTADFAAADKADFAGIKGDLTRPFIDPKQVRCHFRLITGRTDSHTD